jgi:hypothetical protein
VIHTGKLIDGKTGQEPEPESLTEVVEDWPDTAVEVGQ